MNSVAYEGFMRALGRTEFGLVRAPDVFSDADAHTPADGMVWGVIHALSDTEIAAIEWEGVAVAGYVGITLTAGTRIYGHWTSFEAASGSYECLYLDSRLL